MGLVEIKESFQNRFPVMLFRRNRRESVIGLQWRNKPNQVSYWRLPYENHNRKPRKDIFWISQNEYKFAVLDKFEIRNKDSLGESTD